MVFKIFSVVLLIVAVQADVNTLIKNPGVMETFPPAEYNFEYSVNDAETGDVKNQKEVRHGDNVQGSYSLLEADGTRRVVEYTADEATGFNAVVHLEPPTHTIAFAPNVAKTGAQAFPEHRL